MSTRWDPRSWLLPRYCKLYLSRPPWSTPSWSIMSRCAPSETNAALEHVSRSDRWHWKSILVRLAGSRTNVATSARNNARWLQGHAGEKVARQVNGQRLLDGASKMGAFQVIVTQSLPRQSNQPGSLEASHLTWMLYVLLRLRSCQCDDSPIDPAFLPPCLIFSALIFLFSHLLKSGFVGPGHIRLNKRPS